MSFVKCANSSKFICIEERLVQTYLSDKVCHDPPLRCPHVIPDITKEWKGCGKCRFPKASQFTMSQFAVRKNRETSRLERDFHQRYVANQKWKAFRKSFPKEKRARDIQQAREAKLWNTMDEIEYQGMGRVPIIAGACLGIGFLANKCVDGILRLAKNKADRIEGTASGLVETIRKNLEALTEGAQKVLGVCYYIPLLLTGVWCFKQLDGNPLVQTALVGALAILVGKKLWKHISFLFDPVEEQCGLDALPQAIATIMCMSYLPKEGSRLVPELMRRVGSLPRATQGFESLFKWGMSVFEKLVSAISQMCGKEAVFFGDAVTRQVKRWCHDAEQLEIALINDKRENPSVEFIETLFKKIQDGYHLKHAVGDDQLKALLHRALDRLEAKLKPYESQLMAAKSFRVEPEFLLLYGASKQGKTTLLVKVASALLLATGLSTASQVLNNLWQKGDTKYFESYCGQKCMVMDDVFQEKVVPGMEGNEFMQVIRMVGSWSYPLNMASVDLKAKFFFNSPMIIGTTNVPGVNSTTAPQVVACPEAVGRRVHRCLKIEVAPEYLLEGGLDYKKMESEMFRRRGLLAERMKGGYEAAMSDVIATFPWEAWVATKWDWLKGETKGEIVDLCEYIKEMARHVRMKIDAHTKSVDELNSWNELLANARNDLFEDTVVPQAGGDLSVSDINPCKSYDDEIQATKEHKDRFGDIPDCVLCESPRIQEKGFWQGIVDQADVALFKHMWLRDTARLWFGRFTEFYKKHPVLGSLLSFSAGYAIGTTICKLLELIVPALLGIAKSVVGMIGGLFGFGKKINEDEQVGEHSNVKEASVDMRPKVSFPTSITTQSFDASQFEVKHNHVYNNTYKIVSEGSQSAVIGQMLFVEGYLAVMPAHYRADMESKLRLTDNLALIAAGQDSMVVRVSVEQFLEQPHLIVDGSDLMFVHFDRAWFQAKRKITKFFLSAEQMGAAVQDAHMVRLDVCHVTDQGEGKYMASRHTMNAPKAVHVPELVIKGHTRKDLIEYQMQTAVGMCGAPLTLADPRHFGGRLVLGIHIAGSVGVFARRAFAAPLTTELVGEVVKHFAHLQHSVKDSFEEDLSSRGVVLEECPVETHSGLKEAGLTDGSFELICGVERPISLAPNSKLKKSPIGEVEPFGPMGQKPAHLKSTFVDGVRKYPMVEGLRNYQSPLEIRKVEGIRSTVDVATQPFREKTQFETRRLFSFKEAVMGVEGLKIRAVNRTTSPGFPYVYTCSRGKTEFFGVDGEYDLTSDKCKELEKRVAYVIDEARKGVRLGHVCLDFLKDELRPDEKVDTCQTRIISGSPIDYVLACRIMFGAFIAACFRHHTVTGLCPGINPYSDWWELVAHLKSSGKNKFFDGDFKRFDASEQPYMHWEILDFINRWYDDGPENARIRTVLWMDLVHSRHISGMTGDIRYIVQWNKSLPSGHPLTTIVNSWYSLIALTACFRHLTYQVVPFRDMWSHFSPATFGDDNIAGISDTVADVFNQVTVAEKMQELFGLTYTSGVKGEALRPHKTLEECTFLKRGFAIDESDYFGGWVAPLAPGSFLYTSYYYKNAKSMSKELAIKLDGTLGEMSLHSMDFWNEHAPKVMEVMRKDLGVEPMFTSRDGYREETASKTDFWF